MAFNKMPRIKGGEKKQNKIVVRLNIVKDPLSKIFLLFTLLNRFKVFHCHLIKLFMQFLNLFKTINKGDFTKL